jgi:predicted benzoate:H+ symporter BenE
LCVCSSLHGHSLHPSITFLLIRFGRRFRCRYVVIIILVVPRKDAILDHDSMVYTTKMPLTTGTSTSPSFVRGGILPSNLIGSRQHVQPQGVHE